MEKLQRVSPYTPYTYLIEINGVYTLYIIIPIYLGQQIRAAGVTKEVDSQELKFEINGTPDSSNRLILEPLELELQYDVVDSIEQGIGNVTGSSSSSSSYQIKVTVNAPDTNSKDKHANLKLIDADKRSAKPAAITAYNCPYSYLFKKRIEKQVCLNVLIPLQGYKYHPSLEETLIDKTTKRLVKTITLKKDPIYGEVYGGIAISPMVTYQYGNGIPTTDFFEVETKLFESNMISYAKSKPRTMNPDEI